MRKLVVVAGAFIALLLPTTALAQPGDLDCKDFTSSEAATKFIQGTNDPHDLDRNNNGVACEDHPGPWSKTNPTVDPGTSDEEGALPFTGNRTPLLLAIGIGALTIGTVFVRRTSATRS